MTQSRVRQAEGLEHSYSRYEAFSANQSMSLRYEVHEGVHRVHCIAAVPYDVEENVVRTADLEAPRGDPAHREPIRATDWSDHVGEERVRFVELELTTNTLDGLVQP